MNDCLIKQALQVFAIRGAACAELQSACRNFLIIAPEPARDAAVTAARVAALAKELIQNGYAYVARSSQREMEDDPSGVRYLPLHDSLPFFGIMTAVIVMGDPAWAARASAMYPEADIFLAQPS